MITEIDFKVTGEERKKLAYAIGETLGLPVKYTRTPRFDYMIGESILDKKGVFQASNEITESQLDTHCHYYYRNYNYQKAVIIIRNNPYKKKINIHFYVLESLNYLQRIKVDMVTDEFTPYLSVKI